MVVPPASKRGLQIEWFGRHSTYKTGGAREKNYLLKRIGDQKMSIGAYIYQDDSGLYGFADKDHKKRIDLNTGNVTVKMRGIYNFAYGPTVLLRGNVSENPRSFVFAKTRGRQKNWVLQQFHSPEDYYRLLSGASQKKNPEFLTQGELAINPFKSAQLNLGDTVAQVGAKIENWGKSGDTIVDFFEDKVDKVTFGGFSKISKLTGLHDKVADFIQRNVSFLFNILFHFSVFVIFC